MSSSSLSEKRESFGDEKRHHHVTAESKEVDAAAQLSTQGDVDPVEALRVRYVITILAGCVTRIIKLSMIVAKSTGISYH